VALVGQLDFEGREVSGVELSIPGISGTVQYEAPDGVDKLLAQGDRIRVQLEYVIETVSFPEKHNSEGVATDKLKRLAVARTIVPETVQLLAVLRKAEIELAWSQAHGAQTG
jgi:hypothetical protein